jgi:hypothetical protein
MIANVMVIGLMDDVINDNIRYLRVRRPYRDNQGVYHEDKIPIQYWTRARNHYFMTMKHGTLIAIKGRIEMKQDIGLTIICDFLETMHLPLKS